MANVLQLMDYVSKQGDAGRTEGQQRRLSSLAPQVIAGDEAATSEAMGLDPNTAKAYLGEHDRQLQQLRGAAKYMKQALATGNPQAINGAYQAVRPWLSKVAGQPAPEQWTPDMEQKMEQALAQTAYLDQGDVGSRVQSTQIDNDGNIWTVDRNGNWTNSGIKASPSGTVINQPGNVPFMAVTGRGRLGATAPIGGVQQPAPPQSPQGPIFESDGRPVTIGPDVDPRLAAAIASNPDAAAAADHIRIPSQVSPVAGGMPSEAAPIRNPTAAEAAGAAHVATADTYVPLTQDEVIAAGLPPGTFAQRNLTTGKVEPGPAAVQPKGRDLSASELKTKFAAEDALNVADSLDMTLDDIISQIDSGQLDLGPVENVLNQAKNFTGHSDEKSINYATFRASIEKLRNDILVLNKGVQTEGDAKRAMNAIVANVNDPKVVRAQMERLRILNDRARVLQQRKIDSLGGESGGKTKSDSAGWSIEQVN